MEKKDRGELKKAHFSFYGLKLKLKFKKMLCFLERLFINYIAISKGWLSLQPSQPMSRFNLAHVKDSDFGSIADSYFLAKMHNFWTFNWVYFNMLLPRRNALLLRKIVYLFCSHLSFFLKCFCWIKMIKWSIIVVLQNSMNTTLKKVVFPCGNDVNS